MNKDDSVLEIMKLFRTINGNFRSLKRSEFKHMEMTGTQGMMIGILFHHGPSKISELSKHMDISISTVSEMVGRLEKADILVRKRNDEDKRIVTVDLTEEYKIKSENHHKVFHEFANSIFSAATDEELISIKQGLLTMNRLFEMQVDKANMEVKNE